jgi:hypothetical protein
MTRNGNLATVAKRWEISKFFAHWPSADGSYNKPLSLSN